MILELLGPRAASVLLDTLAALTLFSVLWATTKLSYERAVGAPMPRMWLTLGLDVLAELAVNLPGALHRSTGTVFTSAKAAEIARMDQEIARLNGVIYRQAEKLAERLSPPPGPGPWHEEGAARASSPMRASTRPFGRDDGETGRASLGALLVMLALGAALSLACASAPRTTDETVAAVFTATKVTREAVCSRVLDGFVGPVREASTTLPQERTLVSITAFVRAWLCSPILDAALTAAAEIEREVRRAMTPVESTVPPRAADAGVSDAATDAGAADAADGGAPDGD